MLFVSLNAFSLDTPYFKGYAGFIGDFTSDEDHNGLDPQLFAQGYFAGQLHFSDKFIIRSEFFIQTDDIFAGDILKAPEGTDSIFKVQEVSAVYTLRTGSVKHYLAGFYGEYEPIGSDVFLQRQFGIKPITSKITESYHGINGASINHMYGAGVSYVLHLPSNIAGGIYMYKDWDDYYDQRSFNTDLRIGGTFPLVTFDTSFGFTLPHSSTKGSMKDEFLVIRYMTLQSGLNLLIGNPSGVANLFLQGGFSNLIVDPNAKKTWNFESAAENLYFLIEPRINLRQAKFSLTFFNIPYERLYNMLYIREPCGIDLCAETDCIRIGSTNLTIGVHGTFTIDCKTIKDLYDDKNHASSWKKNFDITQYASLPVYGGSINASITTRMTDLCKFKDNWPSAFQIRIGFRSQF